MRSFFILIISLLFNASIWAQPFLIRDQSISIVKNGEGLDLGWLGGLNNPQFSNIDMNGDGTLDVFIFDKSGNMIIPLIQTGAPGVIDLSFQPTYIQHFPILSDWVLLRDFNCDGYQDIYTYSRFGPGAMVFENNGQTGAEWFSIADSLLFSYYELGSSTGEVNIFISTIDVPAIYDVDDDGDLDIFTYQLQGSKVEFHMNFSMENDEECGLDYELKNRCWGYFAESEDSEEILLGQDCFNVVDPKVVGGITHHTGSTLLMLDINDDGYKELVLGDINFSSFTTVINGGPSGSGPDSIISANYTFPNEDESLVLNNFPASFYLDINNDGVDDFVAAPNAQYSSDNVDAIRLYLNNGQNDLPDLSLENETFLHDDMIDVGEGAYPLIIDIDQDGLKDLVVGNRKKIIDSTITSSLHYYKNIGSQNDPSFEWITDDLFDLTTMGIGEALYPTFMDMNGDAALDLILGTLSGDLFYLLNSSGSGSEMTFPGPVFALNDNEGNQIDIGQLSKPQAFDINEDNLTDLLVGERTGYINYYKNTGSSSNPEFTLISEFLGDIQTPGYLVNTGYSTPFFYTENNQVKLVIGSETGEIQYYNNISNNLNGSFNLIPGPASMFDEGKRTAVSRVDINNDGLSDLFIGNYRGGVSFFKGDLTSSIKENDTENDFSLYPNPTNQLLNIDFTSEELREISIYNQLGQLLFFEDHFLDNNFQLNIEDWEDGQYIISISDKNNRQFASFILIH